MSRPAFLGVEGSVSGRRWVARLTDERSALALAQRLDLPDMLARVLAARGVAAWTRPNAISTRHSERSMPQPQAVQDLPKGAARLADAIVNGENIAIITDYDVDGVSSGALLQSFLNAVGSEARVRIPDRLSEGYGPSFSRCPGAARPRRKPAHHAGLRCVGSRSVGTCEWSGAHDNRRRSPPGLCGIAAGACRYQPQPPGRHFGPRLPLRRWCDDVAGRRQQTASCARAAGTIPTDRNPTCCNGWNSLHLQQFAMSCLR